MSEVEIIEGVVEIRQDPPPPPPPPPVNPYSISPPRHIDLQALLREHANSKSLMWRALIDVYGTGK